VTFLSPAASFEGADRVLAATAHVAHGARGIETKLVVAEGADVCTLYDLLLVERAPLTVSEHHRLRAGRIATIRMVVDLSPFVPRRAPAAPEETAIDPVCKMTVERATAAATREHAGQTYYFCQQGCAVAFERAPEAYLVDE
jgi:YHS domain-containing protein